MEVCATQLQEEAEVKELKNQIATNMMTMRDIQDRRKDVQRGEQCVMWSEHGDLFDVGSDWALCHCVSKDLKMGAGIAINFKKQFGGLEELRRQRIEVGDVGVLQSNGRHIYYLVTKNKYDDKPTIETLKASLMALRTRLPIDGVRRLAMPRLGCGLDRLCWESVQDLVLKVFDKVPLEIQVRALSRESHVPRGCASSQVTHSQAPFLCDLARLRPSSRLALPRRRSN